MGGTTTIPVSEYLATTYRPDCDYVDGEIQERNLGEYDHARIQLTLGAFLLSKSSEWRIRVATDLRVQVSPSRFRVPDICVLSTDAPREQIVSYPPLLCIEILSPEDTLYRMRDRVRDYLDMGCRSGLAAGPKVRAAILCEANTMVEHTGGELCLPGTPIRLSIDQVFSVLDEG